MACWKINFGRCRDCNSIVPVTRGVMRAHTNKVTLSAFTITFSPIPAHYSKPPKPCRGSGTRPRPSPVRICLSCFGLYCVRPNGRPYHHAPCRGHRQVASGPVFERVMIDSGVYWLDSLGICHNHYGAPMTFSDAVPNIVSALGIRTFEPVWT